MDQGRDPAQALHLLGLRFVDAESERAFRRWRADTATPFARIGYIGSTPSWIGVLLAVEVLDPSAAASATQWVAGWILLLFALTALTLPSALRRTVLPLAAVANCLAGFLIVWLVSDLVLQDQLSQTRAGVMTAGLIVVAFFGFAVFRIPPGMAMAAVTPYVVFGSYQLWLGRERGELNSIEVGALGAAQWIAYLGCVLVCVVIELVARRTFVKDQIIAAQQQELRASRETIRRYVPRAVAEHIVSGDAVGVDVPTRRRVTVLIADLVDFTPLAERVDAEVLTRVTNDYMAAMSSLVEEHGGLVSEFAGDGMMAVFGAPDQMPLADQAANAVRAAAAMQDCLPSLCEQWRDLGVTEPMQMRIGISTGLLSVGSFGSAGRVTYTAIGLHTNIAARLEAHCTPGEVLLSDTTWRLVKDVVDCEPRGDVHCKGVRDPVRVFSPVRVGASVS